MITIVSGLPRSGTSLMMQILKRTGMDVLTDNVRRADENNPRGYYEYEKVKSLMKDSCWLTEAEGKVLKVITALLPFLPDTFDYRIIYMQRDMDEILSSQSRMLERLGLAPKADAGTLKHAFEQQQATALTMISGKTNMTSIGISYRALVMETEKEVYKIADFLGRPLDPAALKHVIDKTLYRERGRV